MDDKSGLCPGVADSPTWHPPTFKIGNGHKRLPSDYEFTILGKYFLLPSKNTQKEKILLYLLHTLMCFGGFGLFLNNGG